MVLGQAITSNNGRAIQIAVNGPGNGLFIFFPYFDERQFHFFLFF